MSKKKMSVPSIFEFDDAPEHETEWRGMPEWNQPNNGAYRQVIVSLEDEAAVTAFFKLIKQSHTEKTKSVWFPPRPMNKVSDLFHYDTETVPDDLESNVSGTGLFSEGEDDE